MSSSAAPVLLYSECYIDTAVLTAASGYPSIDFSGNGPVAEAMQERPTVCILAMVDDDDARRTHRQKEPAYFHAFGVIGEGPLLRFFKHPDRPHFLIKTRPACDRWLYECAVGVGLQPSAYGFPADDFDSFLSVTKQIFSDQTPAVRSLIREVRRLRAEPFRQLQLFIRQHKAAPQWMLDMEA